MPKRRGAVKRKMRLGELNRRPLSPSPYPVYLPGAYAIPSGKAVPVDPALSLAYGPDFSGAQLVIARRRDRDSVSYGFSYVLLSRSPPYMVGIYTTQVAVAAGMRGVFLSSGLTPHHDANKTRGSHPPEVRRTAPVSHASKGPKDALGIFCAFKAFQEFAFSHILKSALAFHGLGNRRGLSGSAAK